MPAGTFQVLHVGNIGIPGTILYCDFAVGSATATSCDVGAVNNFGNGATTYAVNDRVFTSPFNDPTLQYPFGTATQPTSITAINSAAPGNIVFSNVASKSGRFPVTPFPVVGVGMLNVMNRGTVLLPNKVGATNSVAVAALGACAAGNTGAVQVVNNAAGAATNPPVTIGGTATAGTPPAIVNWAVQCNGTNWVYM
jgi:hypothetical protein